MDKGLINHFVWLANKLSTCYMYNSWSDKAKMNELKEGYEKFYNSLKLESNKNLIDFENLTTEQAKELNFSLWADDEYIDEEMERICGETSKQKLEAQRNLYLIPLYLVPLLPQGIKLTSISGEEITYNSVNDIDLDIRFGCIAYGIHIKGTNNE